MALWKPDPTFYPSPRLAGQAPPEKLAYVVTLNPDCAGRQAGRDGRRRRRPRLADLRPVVGRVEMPNAGDELHHFGWNACSSALCPYAPHPHVERRYLLVPGLRSSRIHILDTKPDPRQPKIVKTIEAGGDRQQDRLQPARTRSTAARTASTSARSARPTATGPGGIFVLDHETLRRQGRLGDRPRPAVPGLRLLVAPRPRHDDHQRVGHAEHGRERRRTRSCCWQASTATSCTSGICASAATCRRSISARSSRWCSSCGPPTTRPRPTASSASSSRSRTCRPRSGSGTARGRQLGRSARSSRFPAEPADADHLPPALKPFGAVPPLVTDINLRLDDQFLYVSCWGTGELQQYDVSDPFNPKQTGSVRLGGIVAQAGAPARPAPLTAARRWSRSAATAGAST